MCLLSVKQQPMTHSLAPKKNSAIKVEFYIKWSQFLHFGAYFLILLRNT